MLGSCSVILPVSYATNSVGFYCWHIILVIIHSLVFVHCHVLKIKIKFYLCGQFATATLSNIVTKLLGVQPGSACGYLICKWNI